jgi:hypothetical protein
MTTELVTATEIVLAGQQTVLQEMLATLGIIVGGGDREAAIGVLRAIRRCVKARHQTWARCACTQDTVEACQEQIEAERRAIRTMQLVVNRMPKRIVQADVLRRAEEWRE